VSRRYETFNETYGYAERTTYFLNPDSIVTEVTRSDQLGEARDFAFYRSALSSSGGS